MVTSRSITADRTSARKCQRATFGLQELAEMLVSQDTATKLRFPMLREMPGLTGISSDLFACEVWLVPLVIIRRRPTSALLVCAAAWNLIQNKSKFRT